MHLIDIISSIDDLIKSNNIIINKLEVLGGTIYDHETKVAVNVSSLNIAYGTSLTKNNRVSGPYKMYGANGVIDYVNTYNTSDTTIILGCRGNSLGSVNFTFEHAFVLNTAFKITCTEKSIGNLYFALKNSDGFKQYATGSGQPQLTIDTIKDIELQLPESKTLYYILKQISNIKNENTYLESLKKVQLIKYFD